MSLVSPISIVSPQAVSGTAGARVAALPGAGGPAGANFASVLGELASSATQTVRDAESASIAGIKGTLPAQQVVTAVMAAEQTLMAAVALRDKAVAAYQEISRMQI